MNKFPIVYGICIPVFRTHLHIESSWGSFNVFFWLSNLAFDQIPISIIVLSHIYVCVLCDYNLHCIFEQTKIVKRIKGVWRKDIKFSPYSIRRYFHFFSFCFLFRFLFFFEIRDWLFGTLVKNFLLEMIVRNKFCDFKMSDLFQYRLQKSIFLVDSIWSENVSSVEWSPLCMPLFVQCN